jgi:hypothetical protein
VKAALTFFSAIVNVVFNVTPEGAVTGKVLAGTILAAASGYCIAVFVLEVSKSHWLKP